MAEQPQAEPRREGPVRLALIAAEDTLEQLAQVVQHLVVGLLDEAFSIVLVAPEGADTGHLPSPPVELLRYAPRRIVRRPRRIRSLAEQLAARNVEVLHALDGGAHHIARRCSELGGWPYLLSVASTLRQERSTHPGGHCRAVLAASLRIRAELLAHQYASEQIIRVLRPGVHQLRRARRAATAPRSAAVLVGGKLSEFEPFHNVLRAFAALPAANRECVFFVVGDGRAEGRLRQAAQKMRLMSRLTFARYLPRMQLVGVLKVADVFVWPHSDGRLEIEVLQAMAAGVPVLVGAACVGDFVIDGRTALSYDPAGPEDLTRKLALMIAEPADAMRLALSALEHLQEHNSPTGMIRELAGLYREHALRGRTLSIP